MPVTGGAVADGVRVPEAVCDELLAAARERDGIEHGGFRAVATEDGFTVVAGDTARDGLDADGVRSAVRSGAAPAYATDWYFWTRVVDAPAHERAFLRWLERGGVGGVPTVPERYAALADGVVREWGQVRIEARLTGDGQRRYVLRHTDDADAPATVLDTVAGPLAMREVIERDADGRYRPLKTAPSLRSGWRLADLDHAEVARAIDVIYPATVANWHRERDGALDVSHFDETAARQTGIYEIVAELPREAVEWIAETCCVDSQCLKRREWDAGADDPLDVPRGDGQFPCREPCSLVIAAARKWTTLEREAERTYRFDLTPSEKEQLEALIDAVADGRIDDIREADVYEGANRYRTRYLRAKRLVDGDLCGVATGADD
jgi:hypothetical protein